MCRQHLVSVEVSSSWKNGSLRALGLRAELLPSHQPFNSYRRFFLLAVVC